MKAALVAVSLAILCTVLIHSSGRQVGSRVHAPPSPGEVTPSTAPPVSPDSNPGDPVPPEARSAEKELHDLSAKMKSGLNALNPDELLDLIRKMISLIDRILSKFPTGTSGYKSYLKLRMRLTLSDRTFPPAETLKFRDQTLGFAKDLVRSAPQDAEARRLLGDILSIVKPEDLETAADAYAECARLDPGDTFCRDALASIKSEIQPRASCLNLRRSFGFYPAKDRRDEEFSRMVRFRGQVLYVARAPALEAKQIQRVVEVHRPAEGPSVSFELTTSGAEIFLGLTRDRPGERIAVLVENEVIAAPMIMGPISGGKIEIPLSALSSSSTKQFLQEICLDLRVK